MGAVKKYPVHLAVWTNTFYDFGQFILKGLAAQSKAEAIGRSSLGSANQRPGFQMIFSVISLSKSDAQTC